MSSQLQSQKTTQNKYLSTRDLYDKYGPMLLGYIFEVVKDQNIAGQYFVEVFKDLPDGLPSYEEKGVSPFVQLQMMARKKLEPFFETVKGCITPEPSINNNANSSNKYLGRMTSDQQQVFCGMHYQGKSVNILALELNKSGEEIRKILKESFIIIRKSNGH